MNEIFRLRDEDKILDKIVEIELDTNKAAREQETDKRNILIQDAEDEGCSHVIVIDSDEFYTKKSFENALRIIDENDYEMTYCQYVNYYHDYEHYLKYPFDRGMYVPFVSKTKYRHSFECSDFNLPSDPTRRYVRPYDRIDKVRDSNNKIVEVKHYTVDYHIFPWNEVKMHHLSWLRADIRKKLNSWSSKKLFENYMDLIDRAVDNFNYFDDSDENAQAIMLFNTPENKVDVTKFPRQFIHPPVDFNTRLRPVREPKKLLFLSMSANFEIFTELDKACNETWRNYDKTKYPDIDATFWTYTDAKEGEKTWVDEKNHIIYVERDYTCKEPIFKTFSKTMIAFDELKKLGVEYDYMIRTNTSTWINVPLINEFLCYVTDETKIFAGKLYSAFWSAFNIYAGGQLMILSKRNVDVLEAITGGLEVAKKKEIEYACADDNLIFSRYNQRFINLGVCVTDNYHSIGGTDHYEKELFDVDFSCPEHQIKTYNGVREECDVKKMYEVDKLWKKNRKSIDILYKEMMDKWYDKTITVLKETKQEYFKMPVEVRATLKFKNELPREEAIDFLSVHQKKCGYAPAIFKK